MHLWSDENYSLAFLVETVHCMVTASHVCSDGSRHFTVEGNFGTANLHVPLCGGLLRELSCKLLKKALESARKVTLRNFVLSRYEDKVVLHFQTDGYALLCAGDLADGAVVQIPYCGGVLRMASGLQPPFSNGASMGPRSGGM